MRQRLGVCLAEARSAEGATSGPLRLLTAAVICGDHAWHEDIHEGIADRRRAGAARLPRLARLAAGRAGRAGRIRRPVVRGAGREASLSPAPSSAYSRPSLRRSYQGAAKPRFGHASRGAEVGSAGHDRLELRADGWELLVEADGKGGIAQGMRLVFPILLAERQRRLRCRPADGANGYFRTTTRAGSGELDGSFVVELAACENAETGRVIEWPPAPLTLRGSFAGLPQGRR